MSLSAEQLAARLEGISATDVAAIVNCHPYQSPIDVFLDKTGQAEPRNDNVKTLWGKKLEPMIIADYADRHSVRVETTGTLRRRDRPWWLATPDGLVYPSGSEFADRGLEIKVHDRDALRYGSLEYGSPGTDEVPEHELIQCQWGMGATSLHRWDLVAFLGGAPAEYIIDRDDELIDVLEESAERFLIDNVRARVEPPVDGSKSWTAWLKRKHKENTADLISIEEDPEARALVHQLRAARAAMADTQRLAIELTQRLKLIIGAHAGITWREADRKKPDAITWKRSKGYPKTDWKSAAAEARQMAALVVGGSDEVIKRALICLRSVGTGSIGSSTRATISGAEVAELITALSDALLELARGAANAKHTKQIPGARPFVVPRFWKDVTKEEEEEKASS